MDEKNIERRLEKMIETETKEKEKDFFLSFGITLIGIPAIVLLIGALYYSIAEIPWNNLLLIKIVGITYIGIGIMSIIIGLILQNRNYQ